MENAEIKAQMDLCIQSYTSGKVHDAKNFADIVLKELFELKRVPAILKFISQNKELGYPLKKLINYEKWLAQLEGSQGSSVSELEWHLDHFKSSKEFAKKYLLEEEEWGKEHFGLCYEYILQFGKDDEIFSKINAIKGSSSLDKKDNPPHETPVKSLNFNYDQIAYELISGKKSSKEYEQSKIISELKMLEFDNLKNDGKEMATAFRFLGMDEVVLYICEKIYNTQVDVKERAGLKFLSIESLINLKKNHQAIQEIELFLNREPVFGEEKLAIEYLRAEAYFNLNKMTEAKKYFKEIQSKNPHYRFVNQRLKTLEAN